MKQERQKTSATPRHEKPIHIPFPFNETVRDLLKTKPPAKGKAKPAARAKKK